MGRIADQINCTVISLNVENMFRHAVVLNQERWKEGKPILEAYAALTAVL